MTKQADKVKTSLNLVNMTITQIALKGSAKLNKSVASETHPSTGFILVTYESLSGEPIIVEDHG